MFLTIIHNQPFNCYYPYKSIFFCKRGSLSYKMISIRVGVILQKIKVQRKLKNANFFKFSRISQKKVFAFLKTIYRRNFNE